MTNKLFLIADINGTVFSINPQHIETIGNPTEKGGMECNDLCMTSGEEFTVPLPLIITMLNNADFVVYDLITAQKDAAMAEDGLDVNDTEYVDETPLEEVNDTIRVENYGDEFDDGHPEFGEYITNDDDLPDTISSVEPIVEGSVANG